VTPADFFGAGFSKFIKHQLNFAGYFDLYNIFQYISLYDFTEKKSPLRGADEASTFSIICKT